MEIKKLSPNLMVKNVKKTVQFYQNNLGFKLEMAVPENQDGVLTEIPENQEIVYALVKNGDVELMFQEEKSLKEDLAVFAGSEIGGSTSFYFEVTDLEAFYHDIKGKVKVLKELFTTWYGMNEFYIYDNNGYVLGFAEPKK